MGTNPSRLPLNKDWIRRLALKLSLDGSDIMTGNLTLLAGKHLLTTGTESTIGSVAQSFSYGYISRLIAAAYVYTALVGIDSDTNFYFTSGSDILAVVDGTDVLYIYPDGITFEDGMKLKWSDIDFWRLGAGTIYLAPTIADQYMSFRLFSTLSAGTWRAGYEVFNTPLSGGLTNFERMSMIADGTQFTLKVDAGGTGVQLPLRVMLGTDEMLKFETDLTINAKNRHITYTPHDHQIHVTLENGVTDIEIEKVPAGFFDQDYRYTKLAVSLDAPAGAGNEISVTFTNGVDSMTVTISGAVDKTGINTADPFDLDVSAETLTLKYSQDAGGGASKATIVWIHHHKTNA